MKGTLLSNQTGSKIIHNGTPDTETQRATEKGRFLVYKVLARVAQISREKVSCMRMTLNIPPDFFMTQYTLLRCF